MNPRTLRVLEYPKILERLAHYCAFSGGAELAASLLPSDDLTTVQEWLAQTREAYQLLGQKDDISFGGVSDLRPLLDRAERGAVLLPPDLLEIKFTLQRARQLRTLLTRLEPSFPHLAEMAAGIEPCDHLVEQIGQCINDRGDVVDSASPELARIRSELRIAQERLLSTLDRIVHSADIKPYLQEALVTQRQGRYVIPVRAEYKGAIEGIIHDQSASGATLFIEPLKVVQQNNAVRELELQEEKEVRRILLELSTAVAEEAVYLRRNVQALARLDFTFAKARFAYALDAVVPEMLPFQPRRSQQKRDETEEITAHPGSVIDLRRARHPLLDPQTVVPIDVYLDDETYIIVITGPNTGGKTVTLKTVGLLALMAQSGLMIPADAGSRLSVFEGIYADIGDEQSIEQNLSTFSSHMTNIIAILEEADPRSLVLLDELGAGTDPEEGSALAMALLENLRDRGITTFATTHYSDLKLYAHNTPGVRNASVEFDVETLSPTYELSIGLPGRSNALTIARRLGLNPVIVEKAESIVRPDTLQADKLLDDIRRARQEALEAAERAKARERQAQLLEADLRYQLAQIEQARRTVIAETRALMQAEFEAARKEIEQLRRQARSGFGASVTAHEEFLARAEKELARRSQATEEVNRRVVVPGSPEERLTGAIEVGDVVWVPSLQASGEVLAIHSASNEADVQLGNFRLKLPIKRLELRQKAVKEAAASGVTIRMEAPANSPGLELDLRGERVEEGLERLERYLNEAYRARLPFVRIIHGHGTGAMKSAVREALKHHPLVGAMRAGEAGEGGDGVTMVKLVNS
ncbi:MAG: endonuclease MutS2 [Caldilinea sp.]|uniref:endonuclease MutS2 n=1 Tax=Caldilinea sp. TaxID=2293560 RepID=UPI0030AB18EA